MLTLRASGKGPSWFFFGYSPSLAWSSWLQYLLLQSLGVSRWDFGTHLSGDDNSTYGSDHSLTWGGRKETFLFRSLLYEYSHVGSHETCLSQFPCLSHLRNKDTGQHVHSDFSAITFEDFTEKLKSWPHDADWAYLCFLPGQLLAAAFRSWSPSSQWYLFSVYFFLIPKLWALKYIYIFVKPIYQLHFIE